MPRPAHVIALCVIGLLMLGVVMVSSADMAVKTVTVESPVAAAPSIAAILTSRTMVYAGMAIAALVFAACLPIRQLAAFAEGVGSGGAVANDGNPRPGLLGLALGSIVIVGFCALVYVPGVGREVNGSHRWLNIPGADSLGFQPSEIAKWSFIAIVAWYCTRRAAMLPRFWLGLVPALVAVGFVAGFIVLEDLGTGALIALVATLMLIAAGCKFWHFLAMSPAPIAGLVTAIATSDYRMARIMAFRDPYADPEGIGYHAIQSLTAIANGGGFGRGLGFGIQKLGYLPEDRTDFVFAVLCEELGIPGAAMVVTLFAVLVWAGFMVMRREQNQLLRLMALGIVSTVGLQACINLFVVTAMAPTKGIALPLISGGGTGWILTAFSLGLVVAIERTQQVASFVGVSSLPKLSGDVMVEVKPVTSEAARDDVPATGAGQQSPSTGSPQMA